MTRPPEQGSALSQADAIRILESRARVLAQPLEDPAAEGGTIELVAFSRAGAAYAVPTPNVVEAVPLAEPTPVPGTPPAVLGVVNHRGRIVTVVDLGRLLAPGEHDASDAGFLLVVMAGEALFALQTDSVPELLPVDENEVRPASVLAEEQDGVVRGVTGTMVAVLDVEAMARDPRIAVDDQVD